MQFEPIGEWIVMVGLSALGGLIWLASKTSHVTAAMPIN